MGGREGGVEKVFVHKRREEEGGWRRRGEAGTGSLNAKKAQHAQKRRNSLDFIKTLPISGCLPFSFLPSESSFGKSFLLRRVLPRIPFALF